jgi:hypothetical protein
VDLRLRSLDSYKKLCLTISVSGGLEMGVKVSSLQMENNTIYLSLVCSACPSFIAYIVIYIKREYFIAAVVYTLL